MNDTGKTATAVPRSSMALGVVGAAAPGGVASGSKAGWTPGAESQRNVAIGYLRAFVTGLVVAHHAVLAYHPFAPAQPTPLAAEPRVWGAFPVLDEARSLLIALFTGFNDAFFMALMFLVSGLFVWKSLARKGAGVFLHDRALRLGLPFVVAAAVLAPLTYYPPYRQGGGTGGLGAFFREWISLGSWPSGPAWFLWLLLAFDAIVAGVFVLASPRLARSWDGEGWAERLGGFLAKAAARPAAFFGLLLAASTAAYLPLVHAVGPFHWLSVGPFQAQTSRLLHYLVYFLAGVAIGAGGLDRTLLARDGRLARHWPRWLAASLSAYVLSVGAAMVAFGPLGQRAPVFWNLALGATFTLSCAASCTFFLALFLRFAPAPGRILDSFQANAYGVYVLHFALVSWLQYALLPASMPALVKGTAVFLGALLASWAAAALLRRVPAIGRVV